MTQSEKGSRLQVPVSPEVKSMLEDYADASGSSVARVCGDILAETAPIMAELAKTLREAKKAPASAMRQANEMLERHIASAEQGKLDLKPVKTAGKKKTG